ncbi:MAG: phage protein Gp27 family protein [Methylocystis sp.]
MAREGRGRLDSFDIMPEEGQEELRWAFEELNKPPPCRTQADILSELNGRLADKGLPLISKSAFNRKSVSTAMAARRINEMRAVFTGIAEHLTPENIDQSNVSLGEFIKTLIAEIVSHHEGTLSAKEVKELAHAFALVIAGTKVSSTRRSHVEAEQDARKKAADAAGAVARKAGLTKDTVDRLKADILGIQRAK